MRKKALFLDRDGVITRMVLQDNETFNSPRKAEQVDLVEGITEIIAWANKKNIPVVEVTNQPAVALGEMDWQTLEEIEQKAHLLLSQASVKISKIYCCFHHPKSLDEKLKIQCECRKPKPGLLNQAAKELKLDLKNSIFLGDNASDVEAGKMVGCTTILFFHTDDLAQKVQAKKKSQPDFIIHSLKDVIPILVRLLG